MNLRVLDCAGRAQRRRRFAEAAPCRVSQSGVALRLPPQSKRLSRHYSTLQLAEMNDRLVIPSRTWN